MTDSDSEWSETPNESAGYQESASGKSDESFAPSSAGKKRREAECYSDSLPRKMYTFFISYAEQGVPSFSKFARSIGVTLSELDQFKENSEFERAYRECSEIRRDYLIDNALCKRYDPSFTKYLLNYEYGMDESTVEDSSLNVTLEVID